MWMPLAAAGVGWLAGMAGMAGTAVDMLLDRGSGRFGCQSHLTCYKVCKPAFGLQGPLLLTHSLPPPLPPPLP